MIDIKDLKRDYEKYKPHYRNLQKEVRDFVETVREDWSDSVDIYEIQQRSGGKGVKRLSSIIANIKEKKPTYEAKKSLLDVDDVAGIRITCHCRRDRNRLYEILEGTALIEKGYSRVDGQFKDNRYKARHINFVKKIQIGGVEKELYCEIQIRTVLGNAWALQDTKYRYKSNSRVGETEILSRAVSDILEGCEALWELVRDKAEGSRRPRKK